LQVLRKIQVQFSSISFIFQGCRFFFWFHFHTATSSSSCLLSCFKIETRQKVGESTETGQLETLVYDKCFFFSESLLHEPFDNWGGYRGTRLSSVKFRVRPPLWIMLKYLRSGPAVMLFFTGTTPIQIISTWQTQLEIKKPTDWVIKPVPHDLVRRIRFWRIKISGTWFKICTSR